AEGHGRGGDIRLSRRTKRSDAGGARRFPRPPLPGVAEFPRRQRGRRLYRSIARTILASSLGIWRSLARHRRNLALFVPIGPGGELRHANIPVVVRPSRIGLFIRGT